MKTRSVETPKSGATKKAIPKKESDENPKKPDSDSTPKPSHSKSPPSTASRKKMVKKSTPKPEPKETAVASNAPQETDDIKTPPTVKSTEKKVVRKWKSTTSPKADDSSKKEAPVVQIYKKEEQQPVAADVEDKETVVVKEESKITVDRKEAEVTVKTEEENMAEDAVREDECGGVMEDCGDGERFEEPKDEECIQDDLSEAEEIEEEAGRMEEEQMQISDHIKERKLKKAQEIFVGGLDRDALEDDVKKAFEKTGEVIEVRLHKNLQTNKNKGFAFVRFANQEQASRALSELKNPVIRGKQCGIAPSEDNDTLFLGNICNTWTKEAIKRKLKEYGVDGVENITLVADTQHEGLSRGFAFIEFSCHTDAMLAYKLLQKPDVIFGHPERTAKVAFAEPLREPDPEIMAQVKSVFVDGLPPYWNEDCVKEQFKSYGEIERVVLARNMATAKRKDFGFVNFTTHDAAVACIECVNHKELGDDGKTKVKVRARLANPLPKSQAVKGGMRGGFRIRHSGIGYSGVGRGFGWAKHPMDRMWFERGRFSHQHGHGRAGRSSFADSNEFERPRFGGRGAFCGRGRRGGAFASAYEEEFIPRRAVRFGLDRPGSGALDIDPIEPFPYGRPFGGRHFGDDPYMYDRLGPGSKRTFSMTHHDAGYMEPGSRLRPRYDFPDLMHYREPMGADGGPDLHDYYGSDYRGGAYSSLYDGEPSYGRSYFY